RHTGLGRSGPRAVCRRQSALENIWRTGRAGLPHAPHQRRPAGAMAGPGPPRHRARRPPRQRVPQDEHPWRPVLPQRRAGLPREPAGARRQPPHRRQLRRPHAQHHRCTDPDQPRPAQPGLCTGDRHPGLASGRPPAGARQHPALPRRFRQQHPAARSRAIGPALRRALCRCRHRAGLGRRRRAQPVPVRCAQPRGIRCRHPGHRPAHPGRPAHAGRRPVHRGARRPPGAVRQRRRARAHRGQLAAPDGPRRLRAARR
ncbi:hypothetical protein KXX11_003108, partial [Aspergillus fumigatus]